MTGRQCARLHLLLAREIATLRARIGLLEGEPPEVSDQDVTDVLTEFTDQAHGFDDADEDQTP